MYIWIYCYFYNHSTNKCCKNNGILITSYLYKREVFTWEEITINIILNGNKGISNRTDDQCWCSIFFEITKYKNKTSQIVLFEYVLSTISEYISIKETPKEI